MVCNVEKTQPYPFLLVSVQSGWSFSQSLVYFPGIVYYWDVYFWSALYKVVIRISPQQVIHFSWKDVLLCQHTGCLEKYCQKSLSHRAFSRASVIAIENIYIQYGEIVFCANTGRAQWSLEQYRGYQFCLDSTYHSPDWHFQLFYVPSATRKHKMIFLFSSEQFRLSPNFPFTWVLSVLF